MQIWSRLISSAVKFLSPAEVIQRAKSLDLCKQDQQLSQQH